MKPPDRQSPGWHLDPVGVSYHVELGSDHREQPDPVWVKLLMAPFLLIAAVGSFGILGWFAAIVARAI